VHGHHDKRVFLNSSLIASNLFFLDTIKITIIMKKYQELENKVKEIQAEIDRLKKEEEEENKLPDIGCRHRTDSLVVPVLEWM
jgi:hypothetical protein